MIICNSKNFVVIRPLKTGSTSLVYYFFKSGLLNKQDRYAIEIKTSETPIEAVELNKKTCVKTVHATFDELVEKKLIVATMPCVSTIRYPVERFSSAFYFVRNQYSVPFDQTPYVNPNAFWDALKNKEPRMGVKVLSKPQCDYFPDHAELFNTENLHEHVSKYILERGGKVDGRIEMRKNPNNKLDVFLAELTPDRKQDILDTYAKDFELWEKAYAVYN